MREDVAQIICTTVIVVAFLAMVCLFLWTTHLEMMAKMSAGQKVEQQIRKHIDLGVYDEKSNTFTLPDGRVIAAPITNESKIEIAK